LTVNSATSNAAATISLSNGVSTVGFTVSGLTASTATLTLEGSNDGGTTWSAINYVSAGTGLLGSTLTADGQFSAAAAGRTGLRLRVSTVGTGTVTIVTSASIGTRDVAMAAPIPPGANAIGSVGTVGTVGADYSVNKPTIPTVGSSFAGTGPYANYVLLTTIPALSTRNNVDIENTSGAQIVIVRDDGTAAYGASPANASVFALAGGNTSGAQGGSWASKTFKGRLQIYAASSTAFVTVMVD
jgi:hypothetical protein